jgi:hypothetical protein
MVSNSGPAPFPSPLGRKHWGVRLIEEKDDLSVMLPLRLVVCSDVLGRRGVECASTVISRLSIFSTRSIAGGAEAQSLNQQPQCPTQTGSMLMEICLPFTHRRPELRQGDAELSLLPVSWSAWRLVVIHQYRDLACHAL